MATSYLGAFAKVISSADARNRQYWCSLRSDVSPSAHLFSLPQKPLAWCKSEQALEPRGLVTLSVRTSGRASVREGVMVFQSADPSSLLTSSAANDTGPEAQSTVHYCLFDTRDGARTW